VLMRIALFKSPSVSFPSAFSFLNTIQVYDLPSMTCSLCL
jgi:hypothetical protein